MPDIAKLTELAIQLDATRILANEIPGTDLTIYTDVAVALQKTLKVITGDEAAAQEVYQRLLEGDTVQLALDAVQRTPAVVEECWSDLITHATYGRTRITVTRYRHPDGAEIQTILNTAIDTGRTWAEYSINGQKTTALAAMKRISQP